MICQGGPLGKASSHAEGMWPTIVQEGASSSPLSWVARLHAWIKEVIWILGVPRILFFLFFMESPLKSVQDPKDPVQISWGHLTHFLGYFL